MQTARTRPVSALLGLVVTLLCLAAYPASAQTHIYTLNNTYADSNGGPSLVPNGSTGTGTLSASGYTFAADQGLSLTNALTDPGNYSISLTFSLTDINSLNGYKKLIDFKNLGSDNGLYVLNGELDYFRFANGPVVIAANQSVTVNLTRNSATQLVTGSVNGVQQFSFTDTTNDAVFSTANGQINFFQDDTQTAGQREASGGTVTRISISAPVPEASTTVSLGLLLALGLGGLVVAAKRKKTTS